jgi:hypothetical protein
MDDLRVVHLGSAGVSNPISAVSFASPGRRFASFTAAFRFVTQL